MLYIRYIYHKGICIYVQHILYVQFQDKVPIAIKSLRSHIIIDYSLYVNYYIMDHKNN